MRLAGVQVPLRARSPRPVCLSVSCSSHAADVPRGPAPGPTYPRRRPGHRSKGNLLPACAPKTEARAGISIVCQPHLTRRSAGRVRVRLTSGCTTPVALRGKHWAVHPLQYRPGSNGLGAIFSVSSRLLQLVRTSRVPKRPMQRSFRLFWLALPVSSSG